MTPGITDTAMEFLERYMTNTRPRLDGTPRVAHSARVGMILAEKNLPEFTIAAGILHDVIEDARVTGAMIEETFGPGMRKLVEALSHDPSKHGHKQDRDLLARIEAEGPEAVAIKLADNSDNLRTLRALRPERRKTYLRYAKKIQEMGVRNLGPSNDLVLHHLMALRDAELEATSTPSLHV